MDLTLYDVMHALVSPLLPRALSTPMHDLLLHLQMIYNMI
jgi:hypothetical protein